RLSEPDLMYSPMADTFSLSVKLYEVLSLKLFRQKLLLYAIPSWSILPTASRNDPWSLPPLMPTLVDVVLPVSHHCSQLSGSGTGGASSVPDHQWRTTVPSRGAPQLSSVPAVPLKPSTVPLQPSAYHVCPPDPPP